MYTTVIFDFFDVIHLDHQKAWLANNGFTRESGFAEASDLLDRGQINFAEYLARYGALSGRTAEQLRAEFGSLDTVDKEVVELIKELRQSYKTGLLSNAHSDELRPILDKHLLHELFTEICISSEVGMAKPEPGIFKHILTLLGSSADESIFVDDNPDNVAAAAAIGIKGIVFESAGQLRTELHSLGLL